MQVPPVAVLVDSSASGVQAGRVTLAVTVVQVWYPPVFGTATEPDRLASAGRVGDVQRVGDPVGRGDPEAERVGACRGGVDGVVEPLPGRRPADVVGAGAGVAGGVGGGLEVNPVRAVAVGAAVGGGGVVGDALTAGVIGWPRRRCLAPPPRSRRTGRRPQPTPRGAARPPSSWPRRPRRRGPRGPCSRAARPACDRSASEREWIHSPVLAYHELMRVAIAEGIAASPWNEPRAGRACRARREVLHAEPGRGGPRLPDHHDLRRDADAAAASRRSRRNGCRTSIRALRSPPTRPSPTKRGATIGMAMTEKQGGSDVRANTTRAVAARRRRSTRSPATSSSSRRRCATPS